MCFSVCILWVVVFLLKSRLLGGKKSSIHDFEWKKGRTWQIFAYHSESPERSPEILIILLGRTTRWWINCDLSFLGIVQSHFIACFCSSQRKPEPPWEPPQQEGLQTMFCIKTSVFPSVSPPSYIYFILFPVKGLVCCLTPETTFAHSGCRVHKIIIIGEQTPRQTPRAVDKGILTNWNINKYQINNSGSCVAIYFPLPGVSFLSLEWQSRKNTYG